MGRGLERGWGKATRRAKKVKENRLGANFFSSVGEKYRAGQNAGNELNPQEGGEVGGSVVKAGE